MGHVGIAPHLLKFWAANSLAEGIAGQSIMGQLAVIVTTAQMANAPPHFVSELQREAARSEKR